MSQFEYLSVLVSVIIGVALTQLLSGAARLIQLRRSLAEQFVRDGSVPLAYVATLFVRLQ